MKKNNALRPEDLMVGDWVRNDLGETQQVAELHEHWAMLSYNDTYPYDWLEPIPLTPEILEKNGWTYNDVDKVFYPAQLRGELPYMIGMNGVFRVRDFFEIRYVHELQHALRLCKIDKEIVL